MDVDTTASFMQCTNSPTSYTTGQLLSALEVSPQGSIEVVNSDIPIHIQPGDILSVVGFESAGSNGIMSAAVTWQEDI